MPSMQLDRRAARTAYVVFRLVLAGVFIWSGSAKLIDPGSFARLISEYGLLHEALIPAAALGLPALELAAGLGLVIDLRFTLETVTALLALFIGVLWFGIVKDLDVDCGCFSPGEALGKEGLRSALYRDIAFAASALYCFYWRLRNSGSYSPKPWLFWRRREYRPDPMVFHARITRTIYSTGEEKHENNRNDKLHGMRRPGAFLLR